MISFYPPSSLGLKGAEDMNLNSLIGYYISQIYTVGDEEMRWIITEYEEPAREPRA